VQNTFCIACLLSTWTLNNKKSLPHVKRGRLMTDRARVRIIPRARGTHAESLRIQIARRGVCDKFIGKTLKQRLCAPKNPPNGYS